MGPSDVTPSLNSSLFGNKMGRRQALSEYFFYNIIACACLCVQQKVVACVSMKVVKLKLNYFVLRVEGTKRCKC